MSFCQDVKLELLQSPPRSFNHRNALVYGILKLSKSFPQQPTIFTTENRELAQEVASMLAELGAIVDIRRDLHRLKGDVEVYTVCIEHEHTRELLREYYHLGRSRSIRSCSSLKDAPQRFYGDYFWRMGR